MVDIDLQPLEDAIIGESERLGDSLNFSADELRRITRWPETLVEDYLNIFSNFVAVRDVADQVLDIIKEIIAQLEILNDRILRNEFRSINITSNFTQTDEANEIISCSNNDAITVTLNADPFDGQRCHITRLGGAVSVSGNGRTINGSSTIKITQINQSRLIAYNSILNNWQVL